LLTITLLPSYFLLSLFATQSQEQQKKDACVNSLHTKQDALRTKVCALQDSLDAMKGRLHDEKSKHRKVMFDEELTEGCMAIYMNYPYYIEFLDTSIRKPKATNKASILQQNLFVALKTSELVALS
jgi:hypothetical protein